MNGFISWQALHRPLQGGQQDEYASLSRGLICTGAKDVLMAATWPCRAGQGLAPTVFFGPDQAAMAGGATAEEEVMGLVEVAEPDMASKTGAEEGDSTNDWLCVWCLGRVASENDRCMHGGRSEFRFRNPEGVWFHLVTFWRTSGGRDVGVPTVEHTWFPGHAWSYCLCAQCRMHLGWFYSGPAHFVGLIRDRIVRAATVAN